MPSGGIGHTELTKPNLDSLHAHASTLQAVAAVGDSLWEHT